MSCFYILKSEHHIKPIMFFISKLVGILNNLLYFENDYMQKGSKPAIHPPKWMTLQRILLLVAHIKGEQTQRLCIQQNIKLVAAPGLSNSTAPLKEGQSRGIISLMDSKEQAAIQ